MPPLLDIECSSTGCGEPDISRTRSSSFLQLIQAMEKGVEKSLQDAGEVQHFLQTVQRAISGPMSQKSEHPPQSGEADIIISSPRISSFLELMHEMEKAAETQDAGEPSTLPQIVPGGIYGTTIQESDNPLQSNAKTAYSASSNGSSVECRSCKDTIFKYSAQNRVICLCGHSFCYLCREIVPFGFSRACFNHFCLHERYHLDAPCQECELCDLYTVHRVQTIHEESTVQLQLGKRPSRYHEEGSKRKRKSASMQRMQAPPTRHERLVARQIRIQASVKGNTSSREGNPDHKLKEMVEMPNAIGQ